MVALDFERPLVELEERIADLRGVAAGSFAIELTKLEAEAAMLRQEIFSQLSVWQKVQLSRHPDRPYTLDYVERIFDDVIELHGDRQFADDASIVCGLARLGERSLVFVGHQKGRTTKEKVQRNFGMAHPEGYRKAIRMMALAERFSLPVVAFIDTPGAYPGLGAEERGQSEAIGHSILEMSKLTVPSIAVVIGEGGSGGALALGVADAVLMLQFSTYSVITPEGCASILWRDGARAPEAAGQLKMLAEDAVRLGAVDAVVPEPEGGAHRDLTLAARNLRQAMTEQLERLLKTEPKERRDMKYHKFRNIGAFTVAEPK